MERVNRNSFIDIIKFVFSIMIVVFHFGGSFLPGGRVAVEGFFMVSGYFMMISINKRNNNTSSRWGTAIDSLSFLVHKWSSLATYLVPSLLITIVGILVFHRMTIKEVIGKLPLLFFEIIPMCSVGYKGFYIIGISWYLSAMMFALAILYPICSKYRSKFIIPLGIPIAIFIYGYLCQMIGSLAVNWYTDPPVVLPLALLRGFAGCLSGTIIYELTVMLEKIKMSKVKSWLIIVCEMIGYAYVFYACRKYPRSGYDYLLVYIIFVLLLIGISGVTGLSRVFSKIETKTLGLASTLFVLNHYEWNQSLIIRLGKEITFDRVISFIALVIASSIIAFIGGELTKVIFGGNRIRFLLR